MNTTTKTRQVAVATIITLLASFCNANFLKIGQNRHDLSVDMDEVLENFRRIRKLQKTDARKLQDQVFDVGGGTTVDIIPVEDDQTQDEIVIMVSDIPANLPEVEEDGPVNLPEDGPVNLPEVEDGPVNLPEDGPVNLPEVEDGPVNLPEVEDGPVNLPEDGPVNLPEVEDGPVNLPEDGPVNLPEVADEPVNLPEDGPVNLPEVEDGPELIPAFPPTFADPDEDESGFFDVAEEEIIDVLAPVVDIEMEDVTTTDSTSGSGPRGGSEDHSPGIQPTEISFMILMDEFRYANGINSLDDISLGTKFGFTGRIATKAEELGIASGSCTVTSNIKKELSYCDIYHKIETDNFGGFGSVMVAGTADEVGGRLLVTGTGGSLQSTNDGYAMIQFDPAGNPVLYVLLKLF